MKRRPLRNTQIWVTCSYSEGSEWLMKFAGKLRTSRLIVRTKRTDKLSALARANQNGELVQIGHLKKLRWKRSVKVRCLDFSHSTTVIVGIPFYDCRLYQPGLDPARGSACWSSSQQQLDLQHSQDFSSQQAPLLQSHAHSLVVMVSSLTVAIFN